MTADGNCNDLTFSEIKGKVTLNGEIFGDVHFENIGGPIHVHTSMTDLDLAALPGDMTLNSDDLRVTEAKGQVRVTTHAKDVDLSQIYGDTYVDDSRGQISIEPAGAYSVDAKNGKGDVEVTLPPNASATVDGHTHNGDIVSDYPLAINGDESKTISGRIGSGQSKNHPQRGRRRPAHQTGFGFPGSATDAHSRWRGQFSAFTEGAAFEGAQDSTGAARHAISRRAWHQSVESGAE